MTARFVPVARAAKLLGVSRSKLQQLIRTGELETFEGQVDVEHLRKKFPGMDFQEDEAFERTQIIKDHAYGERIQKIIAPPTDVLEAQIKRLKVDLNVERTRARDYHDIILGVLQKLSELQDGGDDSQKQIVHELNMWLLARFNSTRE